MKDKNTDNNNPPNLAPFEPDGPERGGLSTPISINELSSSVFNLMRAINPLAAAASPMINLYSKLQSHHQPPPFSQLRAAVIREIKVFENKARRLDYRSAVILAARYFLCTCTDEIMSKNAALRDDWKKHPFLKSMQGEEWGGERFFAILERASDDAKSHIDLLELGFILLNLGYQGRYGRAENNLSELAHINDNLYFLIRKVRGDIPSTLFIKSKNNASENPLKQKKRVSKNIHIVIATTLLAMGVSVVYFSFSTHLDKITHPMVKKINQFTRVSDD